MQIARPRVKKAHGSHSSECDQGTSANVLGLEEEKLAG